MLILLQVACLNNSSVLARSRSCRFKNQSVFQVAKVFWWVHELFIYLKRDALTKASMYDMVLIHDKVLLDVSRNVQVYIVRYSLRFTPAPLRFTRLPDVKSKEWQ
jgi:hypothetical protein